MRAQTDPAAKGGDLILLPYPKVYLKVAISRSEVKRHFCHAIRGQVPRTGRVALPENEPTEGGICIPLDQLGDYSREMSYCVRSREVLKAHQSRTCTKKKTQLEVKKDLRANLFASRAMGILTSAGFGIRKSWY